MAEHYYFGRRPEKPRASGILTQFEIRCMCGYYAVLVISEYDEESGELKVYLCCPSCRSREALPVR